MTEDVAVPERRSRESLPTAVLVCTLGGAGSVAELVARISPVDFPLFSSERPVAAEARIAETWVVTTNADVGKSVAATLRRWYERCPGASISPLRVFRAVGTADLANSDECRAMDEVILRVFLDARAAARRNGWQLWCSLAGGRKSMSATLQWVATLYGADRLVHVVGSAAAENAVNEWFKQGEAPSRPATLSIAPSSFSVIDLVPLPGIEPFRSEPIAMDPTWLSPRREGGPLQRGDVEIDPSTSRLLDAVSERLLRTATAGTSYISHSESGGSLDIFPALLRLPPDVIGRLKRYRIGQRPEDAERELGWLRRLPKAELHCHLGGVLAGQDLLDVAEAVRAAESAGNAAGTSSLTDAVLRRGLAVAKAALAEPPPRRGLSRYVREVERNGSSWREAWTRIARSIPGLQARESEKWPATVALLLGFASHSVEFDSWLESEFSDEDPFRGVGLPRYFAQGDLQGSALLGHPAAIEKTCELLSRSLRADGVRYAEIRFSPYKYESNGRDGEAIGRELRELLPRDGASGLRTELIVIGTRHDEPVLVSKHVTLATKLARFGGTRVVAGFDLAGKEVVKSPGKFRKTARPLLEACIPMTIHAGETTDARYIWEAVYDLGADRVGHGLTLVESPELLERFRNRGTAIEMCPTSNDQVVGFDSPGENRFGRTYPLAAYLEKGLRVTINTDNPGISRTTLSQDYLRAARMSPGGISAWDVLWIVRNGFSASFLPYPERQALLFQIDREVYDLLSGGAFPWEEQRASMEA